MGRLYAVPMLPAVLGRVWWPRCGHEDELQPENQLGTHHLQGPNGSVGRQPHGRASPSLVPELGSKAEPFTLGLPAKRKASLH